VKGSPLLSRQHLLSVSGSIAGGEGRLKKICCRDGPSFGDEPLSAEIASLRSQLRADADPIRSEIAPMCRAEKRQHIPP
jgi:hypothetical protein